MASILMSTGNCAAVAARAAAADLIFRIKYDSLTVSEQDIYEIIPVKRLQEACNQNESVYSAVMEGGSFPDIRDRAEIRVKVSYITDFRTLQDKVFVDTKFDNLFLQGGEGIGTAPSDQGGIKKGEALISRESRRAIFDAVASVCDISDGAQLLLITVSSPDGLMIAAKQAMGQSTFTGGISIVGGSSSITQVHQRDIANSIEDQIKRQVDLGVKSLLVSPGRFCADKVNEQLHVPLNTAVHCYNYPGHALDTCVNLGLENVLLVGNVGKLVKLAAGISNTNSFASDGRREIFASHTALVGGSAVQVRGVMGCTTCDEILSLLDSFGLRQKVMSSIMNAIEGYAGKRTGGRIRLGIALFSEQFGLLGQTMGTKNVLVKVSQEQFALSLKLK